MASNKLQRTNEDIQRVLSELLRSMGLANEKELMKGLRSASGWLRRELSHSLSLRYTPELVFQLDRSIETGAHINSILNSLDIAPEENTTEENDDDK